MKEEMISIEALRLEIATAKKIRHTLSSGLSFLDASTKSASTQNSDYKTVAKLQGYGAEKVRQALAELDKILKGIP